MMQMNKAAMQKIHNETDRLLGDETGAGDDIPKSVIVRRNKKKTKEEKRKKAIPFRHPMWTIVLRENGLALNL